MAGAAFLMLAVIATAAAVQRFNAFYRRELADSGGRELPLDGLRGMAALMVVIHHGFLFRGWLMNDVWGTAESGVLQLLGPAGVIIFFMLTGCLFWGKARTMKGKLNVWKLWRGRLYRIAPLYFFSVLAVLLVAVLQTGGQWLSPENWKPLLRLAVLGAVKWRFIGDLDIGSYNAHVVWTLWYEWRFYFILPFIAWFAVGRRIVMLALALYLMGFTGILYNPEAQLGLVFGFGMVCPLLLENQKLRVRLQHPVTGLATLVLPVILCAWNHWSRSTLPLAGALFPLFLAAAAGNSFFGFLTHPAVRCLGAISFSVYLLHGVVFHLVAGTLKAAGLTALPQSEYWLIITLAALATIGLCAATYRWIEFPFLSSSHKVKTGKAV